jgi:hypothetical protein
MNYTTQQPRVRLQTTFSFLVHVCLLIQVSFPFTSLRPTLLDCTECTKYYSRPIPTRFPFSLILPTLLISPCLFSFP